MCDDTRGQSELLGFGLIFAVVVLTIALVITTGFVGFNNAQQYHQSTNTEAAFTVFASNVDDVTQVGAPSRATELRLTDASLSMSSEQSGIDIALDGDPLDLEGDTETGSVVYDSGSGTTISYRSGALIREDDGNSLLFREPDFVLTEDEVILPIVRLSPDGTREIGGTSSVTVRTIDSGTDVLADRKSVSDTMTITLDTPHVDAWARYFEQYEDDGPVTDVDADVTENSVEVALETDRLSVTVDHVTTSFQ